MSASQAVMVVGVSRVILIVMITVMVRVNRRKSLPHQPRLPPWALLIALRHRPTAAT
jgi:hypothetical protein